LRYPVLHMDPNQCPRAVQNQGRQIVAAFIKVIRSTQIYVVCKEAIFSKEVHMKGNLENNMKRDLCVKEACLSHTNGPTM
jgi:hypothetical protein